MIRNDLIITIALVAPFRVAAGVCRVVVGVSSVVRALYHISREGLFTCPDFGEEFERGV